MNSPFSLIVLILIDIKNEYHGFHCGTYLYMLKIAIKYLQVCNIDFIYWSPYNIPYA